MSTKKNPQPEDITADDAAAPGTVWADLAAPFDAKWIEKLPKVLNRQDQRKGRCSEDSDEGRYVSADGYFCGGWHSRAVHLDYVGHAGITMRLNKVLGPAGWRLEPVGRTPEGLPVMGSPRGGEFWARLVVTLNGVETSHEDVAANYNSVQEAWGDALRRTAMRYGVGTYLWAKSEHAAELAQHKDPDPLEQEQAATIVLEGALKAAPTIALEQFDAVPIDPALLDVEVPTQGGRVKLKVALEQVRDAIVKRDEDKPAEAAQEPATPPPAAEQPTQAAAPQPAPTEPQTPGDTADHAQARDIAEQALAATDAEVCRTFFRGSGELKDVDVLPVLSDGDLAALGAPANLATLPLGSLLIQVGKYIDKNHAAVRGTSAAADPWAEDAASGWPNKPLL